MWLTFQDWRNARFDCKKCGWSGSGNDLRPSAVSAYDYFLCCPGCKDVVDTVRTPTFKEAREHWDELDEASRQQVLRGEQVQKEYQERKLTDPQQLPAIPDEKIVLTWDMEYEEGGDVLIKHGDRIIWREPSRYENSDRFKEVANLLLLKYGRRLADLVPTDVTILYLIGDHLSADARVKAVRRSIRENHSSASTG